MSQQAAADEPQEDPGREARERAAGKVSDVLLNLEWTITAAEKGLKVVVKDGVDTNAELALTEFVREAKKLHKRLMQDTYFAIGDRLL